MDALLKMMDNAGLIIGAYFLITAMGSIYVVMKKYREKNNDKLEFSAPTYRPRIRPFNKKQLKIIHDMPQPNESDQDGVYKMAV
jgi:hypothetical protein